MLQFVSTEHPREWLEMIELIGVGSLACPEAIVSRWVNPADGKATILDRAAGWDGEIVRLEGVLPSPFEFAGPISPVLADAVVKSHQVPRSSPGPPGIDATTLRLPNME